MQDNILSASPEEQQPDQTNDQTKDQTSSQTEKPLSNKERVERQRNLKAYYDEQIKVLKPQVELMELRCRLSKATFDNYRYSIELNKIHAQEQVAESMMDHVVTQDDLDKNPDMIADNIKVGDTVKIPIGSVVEPSKNTIETPVVPIDTNTDNQEQTA